MKYLYALFFLILSMETTILYGMTTDETSEVQTIPHTTHQSTSDEYDDANISSY